MWDEKTKTYYLFILFNFYFRFCEGIFQILKNLINYV